MMRNKTTYLLLILFLASCGTTKVLYPPPVFTEYGEFTNFCELPDHLNELIYTRIIYSKTGKYWRLNSDKPKCKELSTELDITRNITLGPAYEKLFKKVNKRPNDRYLIIDAIGKLEMPKKTDYEKSALKNSKFIVDTIINVQLVVIKK